MTYTVIVEYDSETGSYGATSPDLPDALGVGKTENEAVERWQNAARGLLAFLAESNEKPPEPRHHALTVAV